jgi:hypothetical protein
MVTQLAEDKGESRGWFPEIEGMHRVYPFGKN